MRGRIEQSDRRAAILAVIVSTLTYTIKTNFAQLLSKSLTIPNGLRTEQESSKALLIIELRRLESVKGTQWMKPKPILA